MLTLDMDGDSPRIRGRYVRRHWKADLGAYGGRKSRQAFAYNAYIPDPIADSIPALPGDVAQIVVEAEAAIQALNQGAAVASLEAVARQLLRAESVASSRIEGLSLSQRRVAEAIFDPAHSDMTARSVLNNIVAMEEAIRLGGEERPFTVDDVVRIHRTLLNTPVDAVHAGVIRMTQNWIGGAANNPRGAAFIPPPESEVPALLTDLCTFINRDDLPSVVQAAIAHAQFETIHPFSDGNGRVGRCLIHVILHKRGLATRYVPPISVILATNVSAYIKGLTDYRKGEIAEWCALFAAATRTASLRAQALTARLTELQIEWLERARPRADSTAARLVRLLPAYPIINVATVQRMVGTSDEAARLAIAALERAAILTQVNIGKRNRAWTAREVFALLNAFEWEIATPDDPDESRRPAPTRRWRTRLKKRMAAPFARTHPTFG